MAVAPSATAVRRRSLFRPFDVPADHRLTVVATRLRHCERAMASRVDASKVPRAPAPATAYAAPGPFAAGFRKFSAVVKTCLRASPKFPAASDTPLNLDPITSALCLAAVAVVWFLLFLQLYGKLRRRERAKVICGSSGSRPEYLSRTSSVRSISHATMGRKSRERRCVMAVAPLRHMSGQHTRLPRRNPGRIF